MSRHFEITSAHFEYLEKISGWVNENFGSFPNFPVFAIAFNQHFKNYQHKKKEKLDLEQIKEGTISCSAAALITGIWWSLVYDSEPQFLIDSTDKSFFKPCERHVLVVLSCPQIMNLSWHDLLAIAKAQEPKLHDVIQPPLIVEYVYSIDPNKSHKNGLRVAPSHHIPLQYQLAPTTSAFFQNRVRVFKFVPHSNPEQSAAASESLSIHSAQSLPQD